MCMYGSVSVENVLINTKANVLMDFNSETDPSCPTNRKQTLNLVIKRAHETKDLTQPLREVIWLLFLNFFSK